MGGGVGGLLMEGKVGSFIGYMIQCDKLMILVEAHSVIYKKQLKDFRVKAKCTMNQWMILRHHLFNKHLYSTNSPSNIYKTHITLLFSLLLTS